LKILILRAEYGEIKEKMISEGDFNKILKEVIIRTLDLWDPNKSDLIVVRHSQEITIKLPIKKEQYDLYSQFNLRRKGDYASFDVPLYLVSFENQWIDNNIIDSKVFVVSPYIDDYVSERIEELAINITSPESEKEGEEEELEE